MRLRPGLLATTIWSMLTACAVSCLLTASCKKHFEGADIMPIPGSRSNDVYPDWSPDGSTIIYCHNHILLVDGVLTPFPESSGLWFISPDGSDRRMFRNRQGFMHMDWSPDGRWFVFGDVDRQIWKLRVTGDSLTLVLSNSTGLNSAPMWSPDGKRIAFDRFQEDGKTGIYTMSADGTDLRYVGYGCMSDWSPDGKRIAYMGSNYVCIRDTNGANDRELVTTDAGAGNIVFSPDGTKIAFGAAINKVGGLYVVDTTGRNLRLLAKDACLPSWSPDGTRIIYVRTTYERVPSSDGVTSDQLLYIMNADGSGKRQLTFGPGH